MHKIQLTIYEYEDETIIMEIDIENNIPKKYHDEILKLVLDHNMLIIILTMIY